MGRQTDKRARARLGTWLRPAAAVPLLLNPATVFAGNGGRGPGLLAQTSTGSFAFDILIVLVLVGASLYAVCKTSHRR